MLTFTLTIHIDAPSREAAEALRDEIVGAVEDASERGDDAAGIVGDLCLDTDDERMTMEHDPNYRLGGIDLDEEERAERLDDNLTEARGVVLDDGVSAFLDRIDGEKD